MFQKNLRHLSLKKWSADYKISAYSNSHAILLMLMAVPFAYYSLYGIRLLPVLFSLSILISFFKGLHYRSTASINYYALMIAYCFVLSLLMFKLDVFLSMLFFGWLVYWPLFIDRKKIVLIKIEKLLSYLIGTGVFLSIGLFLQIYLFKNYGIIIGKIDLVENRDAFGFIWTDYSFLSLFFVTLVPLTWRSTAPKVVKILYIIIFIVASAMTSARAGIVAMLIAYSTIYLIKGIRVLLTLKIKKNEIYYFAIILLVAPFLIFSILEFFPRISSFDDSGRFGGYISAFNFFSENILFGVNFDVDGYKAKVDTIPHNLFVYLLVVGGAVFLFLFLLWFVTLLARIYRGVDSDVFLSLLTSIIGFQFVPAIFSAYYFGYILSLCIIVLEQKKLLSSKITKLI